MEGDLPALRRTHRVHRDHRPAGPSLTKDCVDIVFQDAPGPKAPAFVEVEDSSGEGGNFGVWIERPQGNWALRFFSSDRFLKRQSWTLKTSNPKLASASFTFREFVQAWKELCKRRHFLHGTDPSGNAGRPWI